MKLLAKEGKETLGFIRNKWKLFLLLLVADAFFFYSYGFVSGGIFRKFADYMSAAAMHLTASAGEFGRGITLNTLIEQNPDVQQLINPMIILFIIFFLSIYVLYCIIEGYVWYKAKCIAGEKISFEKYFWRFTKINVLWFAIYFVTMAFTFIVTFQELLASRYGGEPRMIITVLYYVMWAVIFYFAFLSYALIGEKKKTFAFGKKHWKTLVPFYAIVGVLFYIINFLGGKLPEVLSYLGLLVLLMVFSFGRMYLFKVTARLK